MIHAFITVSVQSLSMSNVEHCMNSCMCCPHGSLTFWVLENKLTNLQQYTVIIFLSLALNVWIAYICMICIE